jgi:hypothetical protein
MQCKCTAELCFCITLLASAASTAGAVSHTGRALREFGQRMPSLCSCVIVRFQALGQRAGAGAVPAARGVPGGPTPLAVFPL